MSAVIPAVPQEDADLDGLFQAAISGITALSGANVRPRWQPTPPSQPDASTDWCAFGITDIRPIYGAQLQANPPAIDPTTGEELDDGSVDYVLHESLDVLVTFYGPNAGRNASLLRDGLSIPQNMEGLESVAVGLVESGPIRTVSELVNQQWVRRVDLPLFFRRRIERLYQIPNMAGTSIHLIDDTGHVDRTIPVPPTTPNS